VTPEQYTIALWMHACEVAAEASGATTAPRSMQDVNRWMLFRAFANVLAMMHEADTATAAALTRVLDSATRRPWSLTKEDHHG
jgi:hypothetical protein